METSINLNQFLEPNKKKEKTINLSDILSAWKKYRKVCNDTLNTNTYSDIFNYS